MSLNPAELNPLKSFVSLYSVSSALCRGKSLIPAHVPVSVGDKLRVLYGPSAKESKITYEAKVK